MIWFFDSDFAKEARSIGALYRSFGWRVRLSSLVREAH